VNIHNRSTVNALIKIRFTITILSDRDLVCRTLTFDGAKGVREVGAFRYAQFDKDGNAGRESDMNECFPVKAA
jgi:hypothetical protein